MPEHSEVLNVLLSHSRGILDDKAVAENDGYQRYLIELDSLDFIIDAKRTSKVSYTYVIRSYDRRFKRYSATPYTRKSVSKMPVVAVPPSKSTLMPRIKIPGKSKK